MAHDSHKNTTLQWHQTKQIGVSNHQSHDCLLNHLFKAQIKKNIRAPRHWPFCGEFTGDQWIPCTKGQLCGKCLLLAVCSITKSWWHHDMDMLSILLAIWSLVNSLHKGTLMQNFFVRLNKLLNKQSGCWLFQIPEYLFDVTRMVAICNKWICIETYNLNEFINNFIKLRFGCRQITSAK